MPVFKIASYESAKSAGCFSMFRQPIDDITKTNSRIRYFSHNLSYYTVLIIVWITDMDYILMIL